MTEDEKYEIATLAGELERKRCALEMRMFMNFPTNLLEREKAMAEHAIAQTEYLEASQALSRAQTRIACRASPHLPPPG